MEIAKISPTSVKIKSKLGTFAIDPLDTKGTLEADAVLFLNRTLKQQDINVASPTVIINGPGEYEIKGVKFTGLGRGDTIAYTGKFDNVDTLIVKASSFNSTKELTRDCNILLVEADVVIDQSMVALTNASIVVLYGEKSTESVAALGKEATIAVNKMIMTKDKLPTDMQVVVVG